MRRLLLTLLYYLGGTGSVQQPSPPLDLNFMQGPPDSYLVFCTPQIHEEWVTQVQWKEEHANGTCSVIAVINPHWGNYTNFPYQKMVTLHKRDGKTYMIEITALEICVCCEVVTFPFGNIHKNCITIEEDSDVYNLRYALLGSLLVGGFFVLGSFVLACHICWTRKTSRRVFNLRGQRQQAWARSQRSQVPYRRASPSTNLAYEPPHGIDLHNDAPPPTRAHLQHPHPTIHPPSGDLPPRNPTMNSHRPSEDLCQITPTLFSVPPLRNHAVHEVLPKLHPIYSNIHHRHTQCPKVRHVKSLQIESTIKHHPPETFCYDGTDPTSSIPHYCTKSYPWLSEGTPNSSEDIASPQPSRLNGPSTPESPFTTVNPMYHSGTGWASHPNNAHLKYDPSIIL